MKALIPAFALLSFVAASTVPFVAAAQNAMPPAHHVVKKHHAMHKTAAHKTMHKTMHKTASHKTGKHVAAKKPMPKKNATPPSKG